MTRFFQSSARAAVVVVTLLAAAGFSAFAFSPVSSAFVPEGACLDGIDNDYDSQIDWPADPGCSDPYDNDEENFPTECRFGDVRAKFDFTVVQNKGAGNVQPVLFFADGTTKQDDEFFNLTNSNVAISDRGVNHNVPGVAIRRQNGSIKVILYGEHKNDSREKVYGALHLDGAKITGFTNDIGHKLEKQGDGIWGEFQDPGSKFGEHHNDEVFPNIGTARADVFMRVRGDQDVFTIFYQALPSCETL